MKNKKLLLVATAALGVLALGTAGVGTAAWYSTSANATRSVTDNTYTISTQGTNANVANVQFACTAANASGLLLTAYDTDHVVTVVQALKGREIRAGGIDEFARFDRLILSGSRGHAQQQCQCQYHCKNLLHNIISSSFLFGLGTV